MNPNEPSPRALCGKKVDRVTKCKCIVCFELPCYVSGPTERAYRNRGSFGFMRVQSSSPKASSEDFFCHKARASSIFASNNTPSICEKSPALSDMTLSRVPSLA